MHRYLRGVVAIGIGLLALGAAAPSAVQAQASVEAVTNPVNLGSFNPAVPGVRQLVLRNTDGANGERINVEVVPEDARMTTDCGTQGSAQIEAGGTRVCNINATGLPDGSFSIKVTATASLAAAPPHAGDPRGSVTVTVTGTIIRTAPGVPTFDPEPPAVTDDRTPTFSYTGGTGAVSYGCRLDDEDVSCGSSYTAPSLQAGAHTFAVRALNGLGTPSDYRSVNFRVKPSGPAVPILDQTNVALGLQRAPGGSGSTVTLFNDGGADLVVGTLSNVAPVGVTGTCPTRLPSGDSCTVTFTYVGPPSTPTGTQTRVIDLASGIAGGKVSVTVDGRDTFGPPTFGPILAPTETSRTVAFAGTEPDIRRLQCALDGAPFLTCVSPVDVTDLADGDHIFSVRQVSVDNLTSDPADLPFRVAQAVRSTAPPTVIPDDASRRPGSRFVATGGSYTGTDPIDTAYQWQRCQDTTCTAIAGATTSSYTATPDDAGFTLRVVETASNEVGPLEVPSEQTPAIRAALVLPQVTGPQPGATPRFDGALPVAPPLPLTIARNGSVVLRKAVGSGGSRPVALRAVVSGPGKIEAVATHTRPRRARPRGVNLKPGPHRFVYARLRPTTVKKAGTRRLVLKRTAAGRRAHFKAKRLRLRVSVKFTPAGGKPVISRIEAVRVRIAR